MSDGNRTQRLSGAWQLLPDPDNRGREERWFDSIRPQAQNAPVPGIIQQVFPDYHGAAWYWLEFRPRFVLSTWTRGQIYFHGAVDYLGEVWLNGQYLGSYEGGEGPFQLDATEALRQGEENLLAVRVLNPTNEPIDGYVLKQVPHRNKVIPHRVGSGFNYGGIMLPVELRLVPAVRVVDVSSRPNPHDGTVVVGATLRNDISEVASCHLTVSIGPATHEGMAVESQVESTLSLKPGEEATEIVLGVTQPRLWSLEDPYLYRVTVRLGATVHDTKIEDEYAVRCGFRQFRVDNGFFRLNGKRIFVRSTHTGNHFPIGQQVPVDPDLIRRDFVNAKASGFNMVRFISGVAMPEQLDFCDELGLLVYEECYAGWCLEDSPHMGERFDRSTSAMILRDRNHPSVVIWGLLNETRDGPVFRQAHGFLKKLRAMDDTRLVLLGSGRWDCQWNIGSVSNPGSNEWEHVWGAESPDATPVADSWTLGYPGGYFQQAGDAHAYPRTPQTAETDSFIRNLGRDTKPVFLSEYGIGSLFNVIRETRRFEQAGARPDLMDAALMQSMAGKLVADWERFGFDGVYPFPEDMLRDSQRLHARQRLLGFDVIRSNPRINGYNLTGMLDHGMTGEGVWTFWREWKPGIVDALSDGWAPLRWCLFVDPLHGYVGRRFRVEAVLANEDVLGPGSYPVTLRISGPQGIVWEKCVDLRLPEPSPGEDAPLAVSTLCEEVSLSGPAGTYEFAANMDRGGAPAGGRLKFYVSDNSALPTVQATVTLWGIEPPVADWLLAHGLTVCPFEQPAADRREVILVGEPPEDERDLAHWTELARRMARGGQVIFLSPSAFARREDSLAWLPLAEKGRCYEFHDWLYHKECVAKGHPIFDGLQARGIMDWDYYGPIIPHYLYDGQETPDEVVAAAFAVSYPCPGGYASGVLLGSYCFGAGRFTLSTLPILESLDQHPAADRLLLNMIGYAGTLVDQPLTPLPQGMTDLLGRIGYGD